MPTSSGKRLPERKIPVFSVFKDLSIIKNIFVVPPEGDHNSVAAVEGGSQSVPEQGAEMEEVLTVGRHPDCKIVLSHPSISRRHFQINVKPSSHRLFVTDLSSVHGTWVSGRRIEPGVRVEVGDGDTIVVGASTRVYRLHWVPLSSAYGMENPSASAAMVEERDAITATPQKERAVVKARDSDEVRKVLSSRMDGVAQKAVSEEFSCEEVLGTEEDSCSTRAEIAIHQKEDAELQSRDSEEVLSSEKDDGVPQMVEEVGTMRYEQQSDVQASLDSSLPVVDEEGERSVCEVVEEGEHQCLVKEDCELVKVSELGIGSPACPIVEHEALQVIRHEEASVRPQAEVSYTKHTNSVSEPSVMSDQEQLETAPEMVPANSLQLVCFSEEEPMVPLRNDDERTEVSYLGPADSEYCSIKDALAEGGNKEGSVLFNEKSSEVAGSEPSVMSDQEQLETAPEMDSADSLQLVPFSKEEMMLPLRNDNEMTEVPYLGIGDSEYCSMKDALAEGGNKDVSVLFQGESTEVANLYSSLLFATVKAHLDREISLMNKREHLDVARLEVNVSLTVENLLKAGHQQVSFDGEDEMTSLSNNDGLSELDCGSSSMKNQEGMETDVCELECRSSSTKDQEGLETGLSELFCESSSVKNQEGLDIGLSELDSVNMHMNDENLFGIDLQHDPFMDKDLLVAGLQLVSFDKKEEMSSLCFNDIEIAEVPTNVQTDFGDDKTSPVSAQEHLEIGHSKARNDHVLTEVTPAVLTDLGDSKTSPLKEHSEVDSGNLPFMVKDLSADELQEAASMGKEDMESGEVEDLGDGKTSAVLTDLGDSKRSPLKEHSEADLGNLPLMVEDLSADELPEVPSMGKEEMESPRKYDGEVAELPVLETCDTADIERTDGNEHENFDVLTMTPERYNTEGAPVTKGGDKNGSAALVSGNPEFDELTRNVECDSAEDGPPKRSSTESLETEISMEDFDSLMFSATKKANPYTSRSPNENRDQVESLPLEPDSLNLSLEVVNLSEANISEWNEDTFDELNRSPRVHSFEEASPKSPPLRSLMEVSDAVDLDSVFVATVESDLKSKTSLDEDRRHLDMCLFDAESFSISSSRVANLDTAASIDQQSASESVNEQNRTLSLDGSLPCDAAMKEDQKELGLVNHVQEWLSTEEQEMEMQDQSSPEKPQVYDNSTTTICSVSVVTESVGSSMSVEELLSKIMGNEESTTPQSVLVPVQILEEDPKSKSVKIVKRTSVQRRLRRGEEPSSAVQLRKNKSTGKVSLDNGSPKPELSPLGGSESLEEFFTPDKENRSPNNRLPSRTRGLKSPLSSKIKITTKVLAEGVNENSTTPKAIQPGSIATPPTASGDKVQLGLQLVLRDRMAERMPLQNLIIRSSGRASLGSASTGTPRSSAEQSFVNSNRGRQKRWIMVVDAFSLLDNESRKSLQLLQGLRGTRLIIPRMVKSELDSLKSTGRLFRRTTEATKVLEWIEECKSETGWWIHVQEPLLLPTPPASPESAWMRWYSPYQAMPSSKPEDHVLASALFYKKLCREGKQVVLISQDDNLKAKAMAEGLICETAEEFRGSLVNPFSERFLWAESSPRGQTWSVKDDVVLKETFYQSPTRKLSRAEFAKGLKLVLLNNSHNGFPCESIRTV